MRILVACEYSGRVRDAFIAKGHSAMSCDLLPSETEGEHYHGDVFDLDFGEFDMLIAFPPCTHLSSAGAPSWKQKQKDGRQQEAINFVMKLYNSDCPMIAIENPVGRLSTVWRKPDQIINPFEFGHPYMKKTCLWLRGLPLIKSTEIVTPTHHWCSNSTQGGKLKDGTRKKSALPIRKAWDSAKDRSLTFTGIAQAMASQWGDEQEFKLVSN